MFEAENIFLVIKILETTQQEHSQKFLEGRGFKNFCIKKNWGRGFLRFFLKNSSKLNKIFHRGGFVTQLRAFTPEKVFFSGYIPEVDFLQICLCHNFKTFLFSCLFNLWRLSYFVNWLNQRKLGRTKLFVIFSLPDGKETLN